MKRTQILLLLLASTAFLTRLGYSLFKGIGHEPGSVLAREQFQTAFDGNEYEVHHAQYTNWRELRPSDSIKSGVSAAAGSRSAVVSR